LYRKVIGYIAVGGYNRKIPVNSGSLPSNKRQRIRPSNAVNS